jgi:hypothetical protein
LFQINNQMVEKILLGKYVHYKGNRYIVIATATHSETMEELVIYYPEKEGNNRLWARPASMFHEMVLNHLGEPVPRFQFLES